jgi:hypothetical protein
VFWNLGFGGSCFFVKIILLCFFFAGLLTSCSSLSVVIGWLLGGPFSPKSTFFYMRASISFTFAALKLCSFDISDVFMFFRLISLCLSAKLGYVCPIRVL